MSRGNRSSDDDADGAADDDVAEEVNVVAHAPPTTNLHLCFHARSRDDVDAFHRAGVEAGFESNGAPGLRDYGPGYYAAYLLDPDGNNIEALYRDVGNPGYAG